MSMSNQEYTADSVLSEAKKLNLNPYFFVYFKYLGVEKPADAMRKGLGKFIVWSNERWNETKQRLGVPDTAPTGHLHREHLITLANYLNKEKSCLMKQTTSQEP